MDMFAWAIMYVATLAFVAYLLWLFRYTKTAHDEVEELRKEVNALALSIGLRKAAMQQQGIMPMPPR